MIWFSAIILILDLIFLVFIGEAEEEERIKAIGEENVKNTPWYFFKETFPFIYQNLDIIGIKVQDKDVL